VIGFFWNPFLLETALVSPNYAGTLQLIAKIWDAIIDPFIGYWSDITRTRWGRRRPWLLFSAFPLGISFLLIWIVFKIDASQGAKFAYFLLFFCLHRTVYTCYYVPFTALTMEMSGSDRERTSLTQYRFVLGGIGQILFILAMGLIVNNLSDDLTEGTSYLIAAYLIAVFTICAALICFFGSVEKDYENIIRKQTDKFGPWKGLLLVVKNKAYVILCVIACLGWLALQFIQANLALYFAYVLQLKDQFTIGLVVGLLIIIPVVPCVRLFSNRYGKKLAWVVGSIVIYGYAAAAAFAPVANVGFMYFTCILFGFSVAFLFYLPWSMLPDAVDLDEINTGVRREGFFYSFFVFFEKVAAGLGLSLSNYLLGLGGYNPANPAQNRLQVAETLRQMMGIGPTVLITITLVFLFFYPINQKKLKDIQHQLAQKRKQAQETSGGHNQS